MPLAAITRASASSYFDTVRKNLAEKRRVLEQSRSMQVRKLHTDVKRIINREREASKELLEELIPVRVTWKPEALRAIEEFIPFKIEWEGCPTTPAPVSPSEIQIIDDRAPPSEN